MLACRRVDDDRSVLPSGLDLANGETVPLQSATDLGRPEKDVKVALDGHRLMIERAATPTKGSLLNRTANANGADSVQQKAAVDANAVQDAVNLVAIVGCLHRHLIALHRSGVCGDDLINHPVSLAFVSKLNSLCRMTLDREMAAFSAVERIERGEAVEYEVVPI